MKVIALVLGLMCVCPSCSVIKAAQKDGVSINQVQSSRTRDDILKLGAVVVDSETFPDGELDRETYLIPMERGSTVRAVMHGLLDIASYGIWEAAGTPIEYSLDRPEYIFVCVEYNLDGTARELLLLSTGLHDEKASWHRTSIGT